MSGANEDGWPGFARPGPAEFSLMRLLLLAVVLWPASVFAYGEPDVDGLPNRYERLLHVYTNQVRQAPHDWPGWDTSLATPDARPPVMHQPGLGAAARFHADDMAAHGCFTHESCDGTTFEARAARYFDGLAGENIYSAFGDKSAASAITAWMTSDGHRTNMLIPSWTYLGAGQSEQASQIWYVQDFGTKGATTIPAIPAGAWEQQGQEVLLIANFWDPDRRPPRELSAIFDGATIAMTRVAGQDGNETLSARVEAPDECVELYFVSVDAGGDQGRYPSAGAFTIGPGCAAEFVGEAAPRPDRKIVDADEPRGCTAVRVSEGGLLPLLLLFGLAAIRRR